MSTDNDGSGTWNSNGSYEDCSGNFNIMNWVCQPETKTCNPVPGNWLPSDGTPFYPCQSYCEYACQNSTANSSQAKAKAQAQSRD